MNNPVVADRPLEPLGFEQFTVTTSPLGLPNVPKKAAYAYVQCQGGLLRWCDFVDPDGDTGHLLDNLDDVWYIGDLLKFKVIKETAEAGTVVLSVSYYKVK